MLIIGLTGGSGCGKSIVSRAFEALGAFSVDADAVYHTIVSNPSACTKELSEAFGEDVLTPSGALDRPALAAKVFCGGEEEKKKLSLLNEITHKHVLDDIRISLKEAEKAGKNVAVVDAPLLFESGFHKECLLTVAVLSPFSLRLSRIMERDSLTEYKAKARLNAQQTDDFYREQADFILINDGTVDDLLAKATLFWNENIVKNQK